MALVDDVKKINDAVNSGKTELDTHVAGSVSQLGIVTTGLKADLGKEKDELLVDANRVILEGNNQVVIVGNKGTEEVAKVVAQGVTEVANVTAIKTEVEAIILGDPEGGNAIALGGKTRTKFDAEIASNTEQIQNCYNSIRIPIKHGAGLVDFYIVGGENIMWELADGTVSYENRPAKILPSGISYLYCSNFWANGIEINSGETRENSEMNLNVFSVLTYKLYLVNCINVIGNLEDIKKLTSYLTLYNCPKISGVLNPTPTISTVNLGSSGLSSNDVDQTIINLEAVTEVTGALNISGLVRSSASTSYINSLITKGWSVIDAVVID